MKKLNSSNTTWGVLGLFVTMALVARGQVIPSDPGAASPARYYFVGKRAANEQAWFKVTTVTNAFGQVRFTTNVAYVELASGLNFKNPTTGQWQPSSEQFAIVPGGAAATNGQHKVYLPADIYDGVIELVTPGGLHLKSRPLCLSYFDGTNDVVISVLTNSVGQLLPSGNEVIYTNCFIGLDADYIVKYRKGGFECSVVFRAQPPAPMEFGLSAHSRLDLLTEFIDAPEPEQIAAPASPNSGLQDSTLVFDKTMRMVRGVAFSMGNAESQARQPKARVFKSWLRQPDTQDPNLTRTVLIEEVRYDQIAAPLQKLHASATPEVRTASLAGNVHKVFAERLLPAFRKPRLRTVAMQTARLDSNKEPGVVLDYRTVNSAQGDLTFEGDMTYYITGPVYISGTATFEGGTVVKVGMPNSTSGDVALTLNVVNCTTGPYRPAVFTSGTDNSVGEPIPNGAGPGEATYLNTEYFPLKYCRFIGAIGGAVDIGDGVDGVALWDCQFGNCEVAVVGDAGGISFYNTLVANCTQVVQFRYSDGGVAQYYQITAQNSTFDQCYYFMGSYDPSFDYSLMAVSLVNCLITRCQEDVLGNDASFVNNGGGSFAAGACEQLGSSVYQSAGAGNYYLADDQYRNHGSLNLDSALLAELKTKTTRRPTLLSSPITSATALSPQGFQDADTPDLGYHYDVLDYLLKDVTLTAPLTLQRGVSIGLAGSYGLNLGTGATINSVGFPDKMNHIVDAASVQEQPPGVTSDSIVLWTTDPATTMDFRFTYILPSLGKQGEIAGPPDDDFTTPFNRLSFRDCHISSASLRLYDYDGGNWHQGLVGLTNNLLQECVCSFDFDHTSYGEQPYATLQVQVYNNLFLYSSLYPWQAYYLDANGYDDGYAVPWYVKDNLFDGADPYYSLGGDYGYFYADYNGFTVGTVNHIGGVHNKLNLQANYLPGPLGYYYYPGSGSSGLSALVNQGSRLAADAELYHYTTQVNEVPEAATQVDIGYHYVATSCQTIDTIWVDDALPSGAVPAGDGGDTWTWVGSNPTPFSALKASKSNIASGEHQHYFYNATTTLHVDSGDTLIAYAYLDPANVPSEVMLQWRVGASWEHRAYWGANNITAWGMDGTASRRHIGSLPGAGQWVRLEVAASQVGLEGSTLSGMAFTLYGGRATWDYAGKNGGNICFDTDGDGFPDYLEDSDGDGIYDVGDLGEWQSSINGLTLAAPLDVFTPLK